MMERMKDMRRLIDHQGQSIAYALTKNNQNLRAENAILRAAPPQAVAGNTQFRWDCDLGQWVAVAPHKQSEPPTEIEIYLPRHQRARQATHGSFPAVSIGPDTCGGCRYWMKNGITDQNGTHYGACRKSPPKVFLLGVMPPQLAGQRPQPVMDSFWLDPARTCVVRKMVRQEQKSYVDIDLAQVKDEGTA